MREARPVSPVGAGSSTSIDGLSGSSKGQLTWTGPTGSPKAASSTSRAAWRHQASCPVASGTGRSSVARTYAAVEPDLVDRLVRAGAAQAGRTIGRQHDQRQAGLRRLDHGGKELRSGGAARARDHDRRPVARASPSAKKALERSSRWTCNVTAGWRASASASDVERDPGDTHACLTPPATSPSTSAHAHARLRSPTSITGRARATRCGRRRPTTDRPRPSTRPSAMSRPHAAWVAAVPVSTGIRSRPVAEPAASIGRIASTHAMSPEQRPLRQARTVDGDADDHAERDRRERRDTVARYSVPGRAIADSHGQRSLAARLVGRDVAQVVGHEDRDREEAERRPTPPGRGRHGLDHHERACRTSPSVRRTAKTISSPEAEPGVRARSAAVEHGRDERERADEQDQQRAPSRAPARAPRPRRRRARAWRRSEDGSGRGRRRSP